MTRKQERANNRIQQARRKKERNFRTFLLKLAKRRLSNPRDASDLHTAFCCVPQSLGMPLDEFMAAGQKLVGGAAVFFDSNKLTELVTNWECSASKYPHMLTAEYLNGTFDADGNRHGRRPRDRYADSASSGSWV